MKELFKSIAAFTVGLLGILFVIALELLLDGFLAYFILWLIGLFVPALRITLKLIVAVTIILICLSIIFKK